MMNLADQQLLARAKLSRLIAEREVQLRAKLESISVRLNEYLCEGGLAGLAVGEAKVLMDDLVLLHGDYMQARQKLAELKG